MGRRSTRAGRTASSGSGRGRTLLVAMIVVVVAGVAAWYVWHTPSFAVTRRADRNVLLVTIDTLRADVLGSYGGPVATPNLDRLAAAGARFEFAHAHAVVTLPSHASILTGRYPYEHGIRDNLGYRLDAGAETAATHLKQAGFATGAFVGGFPLDQRFGLGAGFDVYDDRVGEIVSARAGVLPERPADTVVAAAQEWIERQPTKWFAWVHVFDPHTPYLPPDEWLARYPNDPYYGEVAWTDFVLGRLFASLDRQSRPTLVIVTSDHGEGLGDHGEDTHKVFAYEPTLRVPLIIAEIDPTSLERAGVTIASPARHVDLLPTLLEAVGAPEAEGLPGASLVDVVDAGGGEDRPAYFEALSPNIVRGWAPLRGVLVGREKYIDLPLAELYDLESDPGELANRIASDPERVRVLAGVLRTFNVEPPGRPSAETAAARERMRALGYIGSGASAPARSDYTEADDPKRLIELESLLHRASDAYQRGEFDEAIGLYQQVLDRRADTEDAYVYLSFVYWDSGQPAAAIETLDRALRQGITSNEVRVRLAQYLADSGQPERAIALLEGATGEDADAFNALGLAYAHAGRLDEALGAFEAMLEIDPTSGLAHQNIGVIKLQRNDVAGAEASLTRALEIDPALPGAYTALGVVLKRTNRPDEAITAWEQAVTLDPRELDALYNLAFAMAEAGRMAAARFYGEEYIATAPPALFAADIARIRQLIGGF